MSPEETHESPFRPLRDKPEGSWAGPATPRETSLRTRCFLRVCETMKSTLRENPQFQKKCPTLPLFPIHRGGHSRGVGTRGEGTEWESRPCPHAPSCRAQWGRCLLCLEGAGPGPRAVLCTSRPQSLHRTSHSQPQIRCHLKDKRTAMEQWDCQQDIPP